MTNEKRRKPFQTVRASLDAYKHHDQLKGESFRLFVCMLLRAYRSRESEPDPRHGTVRVRAQEWQRRLCMSAWQWKSAVRVLIDSGYIERVHRGNQSGGTLYRIPKFDDDYEDIITHRNLRSVGPDRLSADGRSGGLDRPSGKTAPEAQSDRADLLGRSRPLERKNRSVDPDRPSKQVDESAREGAREAQTARANIIGSDSQYVGSSSARTTTEGEDAEVWSGDLKRAFADEFESVFGYSYIDKPQDEGAFERAVKAVRVLPGTRTEQLTLYRKACRTFLRLKDPDDSYLTRHGHQAYVLLNPTRLDTHLQRARRDELDEQARVHTPSDEAKPLNPMRPETFSSFDEWKRAADEAAPALVDQGTAMSKGLLRGWWESATAHFEIVAPNPWLTEEVES